MANSRQRAVMSWRFLHDRMRRAGKPALAVGGRAWNRGGGSGGRRRQRQRRVDPAGIDPAVEAVGGLGIDIVGMLQQAAEGRLDMAARAAEAVVKVEMPERGIEIVAPQQADYPAAEPHAFG